MGRLRSPYVWMAIGAVATLAPLVPSRGVGWIASLAGLCIFSVMNPLMCALGAHWWRDTFVSAVVWFVIFATAGALPGVTALREGAMVFLLPMMIYPAAVLTSGFIRLIRFNAARKRVVAES